MDLDTRFLADIVQANVEVIEADFLSDPRIGDSFDLVFTRFVLLHLSDPERAVHRMAELAKPNGWVLAIDCDLRNLSAADPSHSKASRFDEVCRKAEAYHHGHRTMSYRMGRSLPKLFEEVGLVDIDCSAWTNVSRGGSLQAEFWRRSFEVSGPNMMASGELSQDDQELRLSVMADPTFRFLEALWFRVFGKKPSM